jgi:hypothetical protein
MANENIQYNLICDSAGKSLSGEKNYRLHLPEDIPACNFWSVIVYDKDTGLMINTDQSWPSVYSSCKKLLVSHDGSVEVWFGPIAPSGKENNWIKTIPGKEWNMILRLYEPLESGVNMTWKPGDIELI